MFGDALLSLDRTNPDYIGIDLPSKIGSKNLDIHPTSWGTISPLMVSKVQIVHARMAVGWSGVKFAAERAFARIRSILAANTSVDSSAVREVTQELHSCGLSYLISWIDETGLPGYRVSSDAVETNDRVFGQCFSLGSGKHSFGMFTEPKQGETVTQHFPDWHHLAICRAVARCHMMFSNEIFTQDNFYNYYGGGYEFIYGNSRIGRYEYLKSIHFASWEAFPEAGKIELDPLFFHNHYGPSGRLFSDRYKLKRKTNTGYQLTRKRFEIHSLIPRVRNFEDACSDNIWSNHYYRINDNEIHFGTFWVDIRRHADSSELSRWLNIKQDKAGWRVNVMASRAVRDSLEHIRNGLIKVRSPARYA